MKEIKQNLKKLSMTGIKLSLKLFQEILVWFVKKKKKNGHMIKVLGQNNGNLIMKKWWKNVSKKIGNVLKLWIL